MISDECSGIRVRREQEEGERGRSGRLVHSEQQLLTISFIGPPLAACVDSETQLLAEVLR